MTIQPIYSEIDHRGYSAKTKANPSSTVDGAWYPSYQINDEGVDQAIPRAQPVDGSHDPVFALKQAEALAKAHIDAFLAG